MVCLSRSLTRSTRFGLKNDVSLVAETSHSLIVVHSSPLQGYQRSPSMTRTSAAASRVNAILYDCCREKEQVSFDRILFVMIDNLVSNVDEMILVKVWQKLLRLDASVAKRVHLPGDDFQSYIRKAMTKRTDDHHLSYARIVLWYFQHIKNSEVWYTHCVHEQAVSALRKLMWIQEALWLISSSLHTSRSSNVLPTWIRMYKSFISTYQGRQYAHMIHSMRVTLSTERTSFDTTTPSSNLDSSLLDNMPRNYSTTFNETINEVLRSLDSLGHTDGVTSSGATSSNANEGFVSTLNAIHCLNNMGLFLNVIETNMLYRCLCELSTESLEHIQSSHDDLL